LAEQLPCVHKSESGLCLWRRSRSLALLISSCNSRTGAGFRILLRSRGWGLRQTANILLSYSGGQKQKRRTERLCDSGPLQCYEWSPVFHHADYGRKNSARVRGQRGGAGGDTGLPSLAAHGKPTNACAHGS
jgi:hypothetical protein